MRLQVTIIAVVFCVTLFVTISDARYRKSYKNDKGGYNSKYSKSYKSSYSKGYKNKQLNNEALKSNDAAGSSGYNSHSSNIWHYLLRSGMNRKEPWKLLPNHGQCYQQWCDSGKDCCRMYNICDRSARVCIDCWNGYPCKSSADCCERYPVCSKVYGNDYKACTKG